MGHDGGDAVVPISGPPAPPCPLLTFAEITMNPSHIALIAEARLLVRPLTLGRPDYDAATVASAIRSITGQIYTGVCIHLSCGLGFCAEQAAAAEMIKAGETQIESIVAVADDCVLTPCGRCREFLAQIDPRNADALVILDEVRTVRLVELLPHHWLKSQPEANKTLVATGDNVQG